MKELLKQLGLTDKEQKLYLATVKLGPCGATRLAMETKLPRQTVYSLIEGLLDQGLMTQSDRRGVKQFFAKPEDLEQVITSRQDNLKKTKALLIKELPKLLALKKRPVPLPKVQYYEGEEGLKHLFSNILSFYKAGGEKLFRGYGINEFKGLLGDYLYQFVKERGKYNVETRLFIGQGPDDFGIIDEESAFGRKVKRLGIKPQNGGFYIVGNQIYLFSYPAEVGVMIENQDIANLFKEIFDERWSQ